MSSKKKKKEESKNSDRLKEAEKKIQELEKRLECFYRRCDKDIDSLLIFKD